MLYLDKEFEYDKSNKFIYPLIKIENTDTTYNTWIFNYATIYKSNDNNNLLLVNGKDNFYVKNVAFIKEIKPNWYKIVVPYKETTAKSL